MSVNITSRSEWGSRGIWGSPASGRRGRKRVVIHHAVTNANGKSAAQQVKEIETIHYNLRATKKYAAIAYNFVVTTDGSIQEGRGWSLQHGANSDAANTLAVCFAGNYHPGVPGVPTLVPNDKQIRAVAELIYDGIQNGWLAQDVKVVGHRDVGKTACPGNNLYDAIKWIGVGVLVVAEENKHEAGGLAAVAEFVNKVKESGDKGVLGKDGKIYVWKDGKVTEKSTTVPPLSDDLKLGSSGEDVRALQETLAEKGLISADAVDGVFGKNTQSAVRVYEAELGLKANGVWSKSDQKAADADALAAVGAWIDAVKRSGSKGTVGKDGKTYVWDDRDGVVVKPEPVNDGPEPEPEPEPEPDLTDAEVAGMLRRIVRWAMD